MIWFLKRLLFSLCVIIVSGTLLAQTTHQPNTDVNALSEKLDQAKADVEQFKNAWDKARLETTLYDQRAKRAYQRWLKAAKSLKSKAQGQRDKADIELQLSMEKRKLAFSQWQSAQLREASEEAQVKAFAQDQDTKAIRDKIQQLQSKLSASQTPTGFSKP
jgi:outer membrane murein-binding lipoprotein Lpp